MEYSVRTKRNHTRGPAIVLGMLVLLTFMAFLIMAAPGKTMLEANGMPDADLMSGLGSMYNSENIRCAFGQMNCNVLP